MKIIMTCFSQAGNTHKVNGVVQIEAAAKDETRANSGGGVHAD